MKTTYLLPKDQTQGFSVFSQCVEHIEEPVFVPGATTPLHSAAFYGDLKEVKRLIKEGAYVDAQDDYGNTPLHFAFECGFPQVVHVLLKHDASLDLENISNETPVDCAFIGYNEELFFGFSLDEEPTVERALELQSKLAPEMFAHVMKSIERCASGLA